MEENSESKPIITCAPIPECKDCGFKDTDNCNDCPRFNSEGLDNFED